MGVANYVEEIQMLRKRRAQALSLPYSLEETGERIEVVLVRLGNEYYGLEARYISEIRPVEGLTPLPRLPAWLPGVLHRRGRILAVLDLAGWLGLPPTPDPVLAPMLVITITAEMEVALKVDQVVTVAALPVDSIRSASPSLPELVANNLRGMIDYGLPERGERPIPVILLDVPALLSDPKLIIQEQVQPQIEDENLLQ